MDGEKEPPLTDLYGGVTSGIGGIYGNNGVNDFLSTPVINLTYNESYTLERIERSLLVRLDAYELRSIKGKAFLFDIKNFWFIQQ